MRRPGIKRLDFEAEQPAMRLTIGFAGGRCTDRLVSRGDNFAPWPKKRWLPE